MTKTMTVYLTSAVTFSGAIIEKGESLELPEKSAKALVEEGLAKEGASSEAKKGTSEGSNTSGEQKGDGDKTGDQEAEIKKFTKALDDKYKGKVDELKVHAQEADVQFTVEAKKADVIEAIIEAGKAEAILAK